MSNSSTYDVIIAGGGVMGCATAYFLLKYDSNLRVAIVEKDPTYTYSSTILSDGNVRIQFNIKENVEMSIYGFEALESFAEDMAVGDKKPDVIAKHQGNLFLADEAGYELAMYGLKVQQELGCEIEWLDADEIRRRYPMIDPVDCLGGTLGAKDGSVDPNAVLMGYKDKSIDLGAEYIQAEVAAITRNENAVTGIRLADGSELHSPIVLNSAGGWAADLARTANVDLPVEPVSRQVFVIESRTVPETILPSLFMPSGLYVIHENAGHFMIGKSLDDDPVGYIFDVDQDKFMDHMWEELATYIPALEQLKIVRGWAGLYAMNTLDGNAILGEYPELKGLYLANGFSGHGFQQCHAVGRYLAELMLDKPISLDLSIFSPLRILENKPVYENAGRII